MKINFSILITVLCFQLGFGQKQSINISATFDKYFDIPRQSLHGVRSSDLAILRNATMTDFEEVFVDRSDYNMRFQGANGVIRLET